MQQNADAVRVWFRMIRLTTRIRVEIAARLRRFELSLPQCDVLSTLSEKEGISQQELARKLYVTKGNISGLIDRLAEGGLVERRAIDGDRRSHALFLTGAGRELAQAGIEAQLEFVAQSFGRIDAARLADFEALLVEARDHVRAAMEHAADGELADATV